jgi:hypothetical protein
MLPEANGNTDSTIVILNPTHETPDKTAFKSR